MKALFFLVPCLAIIKIMKRLFFALDIAPQDKTAIAQWREQKLTLPFRQIASDNFHITLNFLGQVDELKIPSLIEKAQCLNLPVQPSPYKVKANQLGLFSKPQVLYLGFEHFPKSLTLLAQQLTRIAKELNIKQPESTYLPHLSIYRKAKQLPSIVTSNIHLNIASFSLYHSFNLGDGVIYQPIQTWPLVQ